LIWKIHERTNCYSYLIIFYLVFLIPKNLFLLLRLLILFLYLHAYWTWKICWKLILLKRIFSSNLFYAIFFFLSFCLTINPTYPILMSPILKNSLHALQFLCLLNYLKIDLIFSALFSLLPADHQWHPLILATQY